MDSIPHPNANKRRYAYPDLYVQQALRIEFTEHLGENKRLGKRLGNIIDQDLRPYRGSPDYYDRCADVCRDLRLTHNEDPADWIIEYIDARVHNRPMMLPPMVYFTGAQEENLRLSVSATDATLTWGTGDDAKRVEVGASDPTIPLDIRAVERQAAALIREWWQTIQPVVEDHYERNGWRRNPTWFRSAKDQIFLLYDVITKAADNQPWTLNKQQRERLRDPATGVATLLPLDLPRKN